METFPSLESKAVTCARPMRTLYQIALKGRAIHTICTSRHSPPSAECAFMLSALKIDPTASSTTPCNTLLCYLSVPAATLPSISIVRGRLFDTEIWDEKIYLEVNQSAGKILRRDIHIPTGSELKYTHILGFEQESREVKWL